MDRRYKYCIGCSYILNGLPTPRCPECGRAFDPGDANSFTDHIRSPLVKFLRRIPIHPLMVIPVMWAMILVPPLATLGVLTAGVVACVQAWRCAWRNALAIILLNPLMYYASFGIRDYIAGTGCLVGKGLYSMECYNVDPIYRCPRMSAGCLVIGDEPITLLPKNLALAAMIKAFGPMAGSYTGPYPDKQKAIAVAGNGVAISFDKLMNDRVRVGQRLVFLDPGVGVSALSGTSWAIAVDDESMLAGWLKPAGPLTAAIVGQQCLVLRIPECEFRTHDGPTDAKIVLIDTKSGRPFAQYGEGGRLPRLVGPVFWRP